MKLDKKLIAIPALALAAGISLTACSSGSQTSQGATRSPYGSQGVSTSAPASAPATAPASSSSACLDWSNAVVAGASNPDTSGLRPAVSDTVTTDIQDAINDSTDSTLTIDLGNLLHDFGVGIESNTDAGIAAVNADCGQS